MTSTTKNFAFFLKDETIQEIQARSAEDALRELCKLKGKSRYWMLEEIIECLYEDKQQRTHAPYIWQA